MMICKGGCRSVDDPSCIHYTGTFIAGRFGNALEVTAQSTPSVAFPVGLLPNTAN